VFLDDEQGDSSFWGFSEVVMRLPEALGPAQLSQLAARGSDYQLWRIHPETGSKQIIDASSRRALSDPVEQALQVPNGGWTLSVAPAKGWNDPLGRALNAAVGLSFSLLLAYMAKLLLDLRARREELEAVVVQRTAGIAASELQSAVRALRGRAGSTDCRPDRLRSRRPQVGRLLPRK
jgi:hypothetical protein